MPRKKKKKPRKITPTDRAFYKLGYMDSVRDNQARLDLLKKTNHQLWDELCSLDATEPLVGVTLSFKEMTHLIKMLRKPNSHPYKAIKYQKMLDKSKHFHPLLILE